MKYSDEQIYKWTRPASEAEEAKADKTADLVKTAIDADDFLKLLPIHVYPKGSYKNNTNVQRESDINVAVEYTGMAMVHHADEGINSVSHAHPPYKGPFSQVGILRYKQLLLDAMIKQFGSNAINYSGNKVFVLKNSDKLLTADIVPCVTYWYCLPHETRVGMQLILNEPDGKIHFNYPHQHLKNGKDKTKNTGRSYKRVVRIMKNVEDRLKAEGELPDGIPSYLIECLAYNVSDATFAKSESWRQRTIKVCSEIANYCIKPEPEVAKLRWREVNGYKFLFTDIQTWTRVDALRLALTIMLELEK